MSIKKWRPPWIIDGKVISCIIIREGALIGPRNRFSPLSLMCSRDTEECQYIRKEGWCHLFRAPPPLPPSLSAYLPGMKKSGKCGREKVTSLEKNGRYNTTWQLRAFKYSHDRPYRREHSCWKKGWKNDE